MNDEGVPMRCHCPARPLLAMCGRDPKTGEPWVHVKAWRGDRLHVEVIATSGVVRIRCRHCRRLHRVKIVRGVPRLKEQSTD